MKKKKILGLITLLFLLAACESNGNEYEEQVLPGTEAETASTGVVTERETDGDDLIENLDFSSAYRLDWGGDREVVLIDYATGESRATLELPEGEWIWGVYNFNNGYFGLFVGDGTLTDFFIERAEDERLRYLILDEELNVIEELFITNEDLIAPHSMANFGKHITYENSQLFVYYITDAMMVPWGYMDYQEIRRYNVHTGVTETLIQLDEKLQLPKVRRINANMIAFTGSIWHTSDGEIRYGFLDLTTGTITSWEDPAFPINSYDQLKTAGTTVLIREALAPPVMGEWGTGISVVRGEVITFNVATGERKIIQLEGLESYWATLSLDGRYIVTVDPNFSYLRKYDTTTGNIAAEIEIQFEGNGISRIIALPNGDYAIDGFTLSTDGERTETHFLLVHYPN